MDRGERERFRRLSAVAKQVLTRLVSYARRGVGQVSLNELRQWQPNSRQLLVALAELQQRSYGRLRDAGGADPVFQIDLVQLQSLDQSRL